MNRIKKFNSAEPWLSAPSPEFKTSIEGFMRYLSKSIEVDVSHCNEIQTKLQQLQYYTTCIDKFNHNKSSEQILNDVKLFTFYPEIVTCSFQEQFFKVLCDPSDESNIRRGFVFERCLRKVSGADARSIYSAVACVIDYDKGDIIQLTGEKFVIKRVSKMPSTHHNYSYFNSILMNEFKVQQYLSSFSQTNINQLLYFFEDENNYFAVSPHAGTDLMEILIDFVKNFKKGVPESAVKVLLYGAAVGVSTAHNLGVAHRDISLENFVVDGDMSVLLKQSKCADESKVDDDCSEFSVNSFKQSGCRVQVIDWGHSTGYNADFYTDFTAETKYTGPIGKVRYMSPELLLLKQRQEQGEDVRYDPLKADVFAFGVCLFCLLIGQNPFEVVLDRRGSLLKEGVIEFLKKINKLDGLSLNAVDLLNKTLAWNPSERLNMTEVLAHPFFDI